MDRSVYGCRYCVCLDNRLVSRPIYADGFRAPKVAHSFY